MSEEIKIEDIINNLRQCSGGMGYMGCLECTLEGSDHPCDDDGCSCEDNHSCEDDLMGLAADRLEQLNTFDKTQSANLLSKVNTLATENELLRGALASCGIPENAGAERIRTNQRADHFAGVGKMVPDDESIMRNAIETYGVQAQCDVAVEEMAELTKAIMKLRRVVDDYKKTQSALDNLLEEIADVDIMIDQLKIMWGPKQVEEYRHQKLERLERRLKDDRS